jgi:hypothetical protein
LKGGDLVFFNVLFPLDGFLCTAEKTSSMVSIHFDVDT